MIRKIQTQKPFCFLVPQFINRLNSLTNNVRHLIVMRWQIAGWTELHSTWIFNLSMQCINSWKWKIMFIILWYSERNNGWDHSWPILIHIMVYVALKVHDISCSREKNQKNWLFLLKKIIIIWTHVLQVGYWWRCYRFRTRDFCHFIWSLWRLH